MTNCTNVISNNIIYNIYNLTHRINILYILFKMMFYLRKINFKVNLIFLSKRRPKIY